MNEHVQKYPCTCYATGICWIVRHPGVGSEPGSYETEEEAESALLALQESEGKS